jgi:hypothetical protein
MKILYIFPHPDDESFGVAHVMSKQLREGNEVYLLTLLRVAQQNSVINSVILLKRWEKLDTKKCLK